MICKGCGLCCFLSVELVDGVDDIPEEMSEVVYEDGCTYTQMKMKDGHCIALTDDGLCSIYDSRPSVCQEFEFGGERCLDMQLSAARLGQRPLRQEVKVCR